MNILITIPASTINVTPGGNTSQTVLITLAAETVNIAFSSGPATALGSYLSNICPAGTLNNYTPTGFNAAVGRLDVTLPSGNATMTGLVAGFDGQPVQLRNADTANVLNISVSDTGSVALNRFSGPDNFALLPNNSLDIVYYGQSINMWIIAG